MSLPELDCVPYLHRFDVSGTDVAVLKGVEKLLKLNKFSCVRCVRLRTLPDLSALPELFMVDVLGCPMLENISVPDYCGYMAPSLEVQNLGSSGALTEAYPNSRMYQFLVS